MSDAESTRLITMLLGEVRQGNLSARDQLVALVHPELRRIAARYLHQERSDHTLRATKLVNKCTSAVMHEKGSWQEINATRQSTADPR